MKTHQYKAAIPKQYINCGQYRPYSMTFGSSILLSLLLLIALILIPKIRYITMNG